MAAPVFTKNLQDVNALEGQLVVLECRIKGVPSPRVHWYREGTLIDDSPDFRILQKKPRSMAEPEEICTLVIAEVFPEDSGMFTCTANNKFGTVSSIGHLKVKGNDGSTGNSKASLPVETLKHKSEELNSSDPPTFSLSLKPDVLLVAPNLPQPASFPPDHPTLPLTVHLQPTETLSSVIVNNNVPHPSESNISNFKPRLDPTPVNYLQSLPPVFSTTVPQNHSFNSDSTSLKTNFEPPQLYSSEPIPNISTNHKPPPESAFILPTEPLSRPISTKAVASSLKPKIEVKTHLIPPQPKQNFFPPEPKSLLNPPEPYPPFILPEPKPVKPKSESIPSEPPQIPSLPEAPSSCLKQKFVNHNEPRNNSRVGLRVHFKLPEDEVVSASSEDFGATQQTMQDLLANKEPPPVLAKPKLDAVQLQILHNQVLLEQQQDSSLPSQPEPTPWQTPPSFQPNPLPISPPNPTPIPLPQAGSTPTTNMTQSFNYTRPKEFIAAQTLSPTRGLSPTESPVPMLNAMAAELQFGNPPPQTFSPPPANQYAPSPRQFPTRVLQPPTSPPTHISSPTMPFALRPQSPSSPTSSSSTPSPIQNPVAFLSSVLPSLPTSPPTNAMGLPRRAPTGPTQGMLKKTSKPLRSISDDDIRENKETVLTDLEKKLRYREESMLNGQQEYKVSSFEQRLMSEIEFRLERTPVEESDDEIQHDEIPRGKCIAPIFDKKLKNFRAVGGVPISFTCKVVGIPIPKVYWFKDGKQILKKNERYKKTREGDGTCSLHIEAVTSDDDGNYTAMAANPQGRSSCSGHLIVQTGPVRGRLTPMIRSQRVRSRVQQVEEGEPIQERFFQPHFLQAPGDMVAHEGKLCRLDCKVSGLPHPDLMWLLNGRQIFPDIRHRMLVRENSVHSLLIDPLTQNDAGTYTCIAINKAGQNSFSLDLKVVEKEVKKVPMFLERMQNIGIAEGNPARLECRVVGMPPPVIYWKKDNESITPVKERMSMHQDATGYVCLQIQPTRKEDAGWYTVSAKNEAGIVSCTARLDIYAQWHQQIPLPMKKVRPSGSRYAALAGQGLDIMSAFPTVENSPILFASSPVEAALESEDL